MTVVFTGLSTGAIYALVAIGFNVVFVATGAFNFAQAQFVMVGTFIAYWTAEQLNLAVGWAPLLAAVVCAALGAAEEFVAIRPLGGDTHALLVTTIGFGVMLDGVASLIWGTQPLRVPFFGPTDPVLVGGGSFLPVQLGTVAAAIVATVGCEMWSRRTLSGLVSRAAAEDRTAARARGINVSRLSLWSVIAAAAFAGALAPLIGPQTYAVFNVGDLLAITAFVALAFGGFGSYAGALVGGLGIGIVEQVSVRYLSARYQDLIVFAVLLVVLTVRPTGLFRSARKRLV